MFFSLLIFFLLLNASIATTEFIEAGVQKLETPVDAPAFTLKELGGRKISLKESRGKVVLVNFFSPSCSLCQKQASSFDKLDGGHHETFFIDREGKIVAKTFAEKDRTSPSMRNLIHYLLREDG